MKLSEMLDERIIAVDLKADSKDQAITQLSQKLREADYIQDIKLFKEDIYKREAQGSTGIGNYIAIPHGQSESVKKIGIAIGKFSSEIPWETLDDNGVKIVCLFAVNNDSESAETHLNLLSQIASKLGNDKAVQSLINAKNAKEIKEVFIKGD